MRNSLNYITPPNRISTRILHRTSRQSQPDLFFAVLNSAFYQRPPLTFHWHLNDIPYKLTIYMQNEAKWTVSITRAAFLNVHISQTQFACECQQKIN